MSTRHRADAVEESSRAPVSARLPGSETPIYDGLVRELTTGWPDHAPDTDPPTLPMAQLDGWFEPWPEVEHKGPPTGGLFHHSVVGAS